MPRTSVVESPGCPPVRALTFDVLGLIKVVESRGKEKGVTKVVERWGDPDSSKCVLAASINDCKFDPLLAIARKCGSIEVISPVSGDLCVSLPNVNEDAQPEDDPVSGLHLFKKKVPQLSSRSCTLLACSKKGYAVLRSVEVSKSLEDSIDIGTPEIWKICSSGNVLCSKVDENENYALFGGKGVEVNVWDIENRNKIWTARAPAKNSLDIFTPTWFSSATFLSKDDHRKLVTGTNSHQVRLYDISAQRRPVISFDFRETPITAVTEDLDGNTVYVGNGSGDLASFDIRTGKLLGCFLGKCSGSIRSISRHPQLPVVASCGLDMYLRFWDIGSRQLLSAVFLKQHLTNVVFDSQFTDEVECYGCLISSSRIVSAMEIEYSNCPTHFTPTRHFSSNRRDDSDNGEDFEEDDDDDDDEEEEMGKTEEEGDGVVSPLNLKREYTLEEKESEAAAIGYKVIGQLQPSDRVFKEYEPVFAVIQIGSHQFKVSNGDCIYVEKLKFCEVHDKIILNKVLMLGSPTQTLIGRPVLPDANVHAMVEEHALDAKVIIFKKKRRKNYHRTKGHRQELTKLRITDIQGIEKPEKPEQLAPVKTKKAATKKVKKGSVAA